jgi:hypothetical protein
MISEFFSQSDDIDDLPREISPQQRAGLRLAIGLFDTNHDGKLDAQERQAMIGFLRQRLQ